MRHDGKNRAAEGGVNAEEPFRTSEKSHACGSSMASELYENKPNVATFLFHKDAAC